MKKSIFMVLALSFLLVGFAFASCEAKANRDTEIWTVTKVVTTELDFCHIFIADTSTSKKTMEASFPNMSWPCTHFSPKDKVRVTFEHSFNGGAFGTIEKEDKDKAKQTFKHPEMVNDEVFVTNSDSNDFPNIGWKTKRKGNIAYGISGVPLGTSWPGSFPVFVKKWEILQKDASILKRLEQ